MYFKCNMTVRGCPTTIYDIKANSKREVTKHDVLAAVNNTVYFGPDVKLSEIGYSPDDLEEQ